MSYTTDVRYILTGTLVGKGNQRMFFVHGEADVQGQVSPHLQKLVVSPWQIKLEHQFFQGETHTPAQGCAPRRLRQHTRQDRPHVPLVSSQRWSITNRIPGRVVGVLLVGKLLQLQFVLPQYLEFPPGLTVSLWFGLTGSLATTARSLIRFSKPPRCPSSDTT